MGQIMATDATRWLSSVGGVLIGSSAVMVMWLFGKITGIIGHVRGVGGPDDRGLRVAFLAGLILAPVPVLRATGRFPAQTVPGSLTGMAVAGLLVGAGTVMGSGCTLGHGVCSLARLPPRSFVAVPTFVFLAAVTATLAHHVFRGG